MSAAVLQLAQEAPTVEADLTPYEKARLMMAARIAAGLCANPQIFSQRGWQGQTALDALAVADKLIMIAKTGGC